MEKEILSQISEQTMPEEYATLKRLEQRGLKLSEFQMITYFNLRGVGRTFLDYLEICEECLKYDQVLVTHDMAIRHKTIVVKPKEHIHNNEIYYGGLIAFMKKYYPEFTIIRSGRNANYIIVRKER